MITNIIFIFCIYIGTSQAQLPGYMLGTFQLERSEKYDDFLQDLGVDWFSRQIATGVSPTTIISQDGDRVTIETKTLIFSDKTSFKLGEPYDQKSPLGNSVKSVSTLVGSNVLKTVRSATDQSKGFSLERRWTKGGKVMVNKLRVDGSESVAKRIFKRQ